MSRTWHRPVGRFLDQLPHLPDKVRLVQDLGVLQLDRLVLEPVGGIDDHADAQGRLDLGIEGPEGDGVSTFISEAIFNRPVLGLRTTIGGEEEAVDPLIRQLGNRHAPEQEGLGALQGGFQVEENDHVEPDPKREREKRNRPESEPERPFQEGHGLRLLPLSPVSKGHHASILTNH